MFLVLHCPTGTGIASALLAIYRNSPCLLDDWSKKFLAVYNTVEKLLSATAITVFKLIALMAFTDTAEIECAWAHIRRNILMMSCQTHRKDAEDVSANYVISRKRRQRDSPTRMVLRGLKAKAGKKKAKAKAQPKRICRSYHSFVSEEMRANGGKIKKGIGERYRAMLAKPKELMV